MCMHHVIYRNSVFYLTHSWVEVAQGLKDVYQKIS
jgi:hypothetical protein